MDYKETDRDEFYVVTERDIAEMRGAMRTLISQGVFGPPGPNAVHASVRPDDIVEPEPKDESTKSELEEIQEVNNG
jgi:hypothetical protein